MRHRHLHCLSTGVGSGRTSMGLHLCGRVREGEEALQGRREGLGERAFEGVNGAPCPGAPPPPPRLPQKKVQLPGLQPGPTPWAPELHLDPKLRQIEKWRFWNQHAAAVQKRHPSVRTECRTKLTAEPPKRNRWGLQLVTDRWPCQLCPFPRPPLCPPRLYEPPLAWPEAESATSQINGDPQGPRGTGKRTARQQHGHDAAPPSTKVFGLFSNRALVPLGGQPLLLERRCSG